MKYLKVLSKIIFFLPYVLIALQLLYIVYSLIFGIKGGFFGVGPDDYGIDAVSTAWLISSAVGILYLPFIVYQMIYLRVTKNKLYIKLFLIELVVILILEIPMLYSLIDHQ